jgi:hypothetical protein
VISAADEHGHGTHVAGSVVANGMLGWGTVNDDGYLFGLGTAPGAKLVAQRIIDKTGSLFLTEDFQQLALDAYREGVSVVNNSWGAEQSGRYDSYAAEYDGLVRDSDFQAEGSQEMAYIFAAGNSGRVLRPSITRVSARTSLRWVPARVLAKCSIFMRMELMPWLIFPVVDRLRMGATNLILWLREPGYPRLGLPRHRKVTSGLGLMITILIWAGRVWPALWLRVLQRSLFNIFGKCVESKALLPLTESAHDQYSDGYE